MCYNTRARGCSSMAERQLPKLNTRVRFPSPAPASAQSPLNFVSGNSLRLLPKTAFAPLRLLPNPKPTGFGFVFLLLLQSPLNCVSGNSQRLLPVAALTTLRLLPNPKHSASDLFFSLLFTDLSEDKQSIVSLLTAVLGAALVKKHDFLATTQRARVVDIILQAEHSSRMVETRKYSKA